MHPVAVGDGRVVVVVNDVEVDVVSVDVDVVSVDVELGQLVSK